MLLFFLPKALPHMDIENMITLLMMDAEDPVITAKIQSMGKIISSPATGTNRLGTSLRKHKSASQKMRPRCNPEMAMMCTTPVSV